MRRLLLDRVAEVSRIMDVCVCPAHVPVSRAFAITVRPPTSHIFEATESWGEKLNDHHRNHDDHK
jgi:hypothetical protein